MTSEHRLKVLRKTLQTVENGWCRGTYAKDNMDRHVDWWDPKATRFCLVGALLKSGGAQMVLFLRRRLPRLFTQLHAFNDCGSKEIVVDFLKGIINELEANCRGVEQCEKQTVSG